MDFSKYDDMNNSRVIEEFKQDALNELGLFGHRYADEIYAAAWRRGYLGGFMEVFFHMKDVADVILSEHNPNNTKLGQGLLKGLKEAVVSEENVVDLDHMRLVKEADKAIDSIEEMVQWALTQPNAEDILTEILKEIQPLIDSFKDHK